MVFSLSFTEDFYYPPQGVESIERSARPTSVYEAILGIQSQQWRELCQRCFKCEPEYVDVERVLKQIRETNTCTSLTPPVEVWIDIPGDYRVKIFDQTRKYEGFSIQR